MAVTLTFRRTHNYAAQGRHGITVPIELTFGARTVRLPAKLDTGASCCIVQRDYAEQLGIDVEAGELITIGTANSSFPAYGHDVTMKCFEWQFESKVFFPRDREIERNVVGRAGWLQQFRIAIVDYDSLLYISHYDQP